MAQSKPNILVFFCDQFRPDLIGAYGGEIVRTPNIDALAADSTVFENGYTPTAICSPARASLLTGLYAHKHHMFNNSTPRYSYSQHLRPDVTMVQDWMADETDYESGYYGKWHIGPPADLMKSRFAESHRPPYPGREPLFASSHGHPNPRLGPLVKEAGDGIAGLLDVPMEEFPDVQTARYSQEFMRKRNKDRPFTLFCAFPGPHGPWMVPEEYGLRYDARDIPIWSNRYDRFEGKPLSQKKLRLNDERRYPHVTDSVLRELLTYNFTYIELVDQMLGEVVATLKEQGIYDDTAIFLTADHGDMAGSHGYMSKDSYMYDEIYRIPMLFKPPGGTEVRRSSQPVNLMDVTATAVHMMAGEELSTIGNGLDLDGRSMLPLTQGATEWYKPVNYSEYHGNWFGHYSTRMVTDARWKLVWNLSDLGELYNLEEDPGEMTNLFYDSAYGGVRERYFELLIEEARRSEDGQLQLLSPDDERALEGSLSGPLPLLPTMVPGS